MNNAIYNLAWPGLNSYAEEDRARFFGRSEEIDILVRTISETPFVTVYGPSGVGKTSLLQAGAFPALRRKGFFPVYIRLDHAGEASAYGEQIKSNVLDAAERSGMIVRIRASARGKGEDLTLWEWMHRHVFLDQDLNPVFPVLVFDQFEEVFTRGRENGREVAVLFTEVEDLCTNNIPATIVESQDRGNIRFDFPIDECKWRIVLSLREDFLPRFEEASVYRPIFRRNRLAVSALRKDQAMDAVMGPGKGIVSEAVAAQIVDFVGRTNSGSFEGVEPALLSVFCSQLDYYRQKRGLPEITGALWNENRADVLTVFYNAAMGKVSRATVEKLERHLLTSGGYRDSWAVEDAEREGVSRDEWQYLVSERILHIEHRRDAQWLEFSHDILTKTAVAHKEAQERRHALERQRAEHDHLREEADRQRRRATRLMVSLLSLCVAVGAVAMAIWFLFYGERVACYREWTKVRGVPRGVGHQLTSEEVRHRWFSFRMHRRGFFTLRRGRHWWSWLAKSPVYRFEVIAGNGELTTRNPLGTYLWMGDDTLILGVKERHPEADQQKPLPTESRAMMQSSAELQTVCQFIFEFDSEGRISKEIGRNIQGRTVWTLLYSHLAGSGSHEFGEGCAMAHFVAESGLPLRHRADDAEYVRIHYDSNGFEARIEYLNPKGAHTKGPDDAHSRLMKFDTEGRVLECRSQGWSPDLNAYTNIVDTAGNTGIRTEYLNHGAVTKVRSFDSQGRLCRVKSGVCGWDAFHDKYGNPVAMVQVDTNGMPCADANGICRTVRRYGENCVTEEYFNAEGLPTANQIGVARQVMTFGNLNSLSQFDMYAPFGKGGIWGNTNVCHVALHFDEWQNLTRQVLSDLNGTTSTNYVQGAYWTFEKDQNDRIIRDDGYAYSSFGGVNGKEGVLHVVRLFDGNGHLTNETYFGVSDSPVVDTNGIVRVAYEYDRDGMCVRADAYAPGGRGGVWGQPRIHHVMRLYDGRLNITNETYYGVDEMLSTDLNGIACMETTYNDEGEVVRVDLHTSDSSDGIWGKSDVHHVVKLYDGHGICTNETRFAVSGEEVVSTWWNRCDKAYLFFWVLVGVWVMVALVKEIW